MQGANFSKTWPCNFLLSSLLRLCCSAACFLGAGWLTVSLPRHTESRASILKFAMPLRHVDGTASNLQQQSCMHSFFLLGARRRQRPHVDTEYSRAQFGVGTVHRECESWRLAPSRPGGGRALRETGKHSIATHLQYSAAYRLTSHAYGSGRGSRENELVSSRVRVKVERERHLGQQPPADSIRCVRFFDFFLSFFFPPLWPGSWIDFSWRRAGKGGFASCPNERAFTLAPCQCAVPSKHCNSLVKLLPVAPRRRWTSRPCL